MSLAPSSFVVAQQKISGTFSAMPTPLHGMEHEVYAELVTKVVTSMRDTAGLVMRSSDVVETGVRVDFSAWHYESDAHG
jgi:hypothetical protein